MMPVVLIRVDHAKIHAKTARNIVRAMEGVVFVIIVIVLVKIHVKIQNLVYVVMMV
jgi:hypothetical protein